MATAIGIILADTLRAVELDSVAWNPFVLRVSVTTVVSPARGLQVSALYREEEGCGENCLLFAIEQSSVGYADQPMVSGVCVTIFLSEPTQLFCSFMGLSSNGRTDRS